MSDKDTLLEMFRRAGVEFKDAGTETVNGYSCKGVSYATCTLIEVDGGYPGFYSIFIFKEDGSLLTVEAYE
jgi:hypothetical protein